MPKNRRLQALRYLPAILALTACGSLGSAQDKQDAESNTRTVEGTVLSASRQPVRGAVVQLENTKTLQIRSFVTKEDGAYRFAGLSTNDEYALRADYNGASSSTRRLNVFGGRKTVRIDLKLNK